MRVKDEARQKFRHLFLERCYWTVQQGRREGKIVLPSGKDQIDDKGQKYSTFIRGAGDTFACKSSCAKHTISGGEPFSEANRNIVCDSELLLSTFFTGLPCAARINDDLGPFTPTELYLKMEEYSTSYGTNNPYSDVQANVNGVNLNPLHETGIDPPADGLSSLCYVARLDFNFGGSGKRVRAQGGAYTDCRDRQKLDPDNGATLDGGVSWVNAVRRAALGAVQRYMFEDETKTGDDSYMGKVSFKGKKRKSHGLDSLTIADMERNKRAVINSFHRVPTETTGRSCFGNFTYEDFHAIMEFKTRYGTARTPEDDFDTKFGDVSLTTATEECGWSTEDLEFFKVGGTFDTFTHTETATVAGVGDIVTKGYLQYADSNGISFACGDNILIKIDTWNQNRDASNQYSADSYENMRDICLAQRYAGCIGLAKNAEEAVFHLVHILDITGTGDFTCRATEGNFFATAGQFYFVPCYGIRTISDNFGCEEAPHLRSDQTDFRFDMGGPRRPFNHQEARKCG